MKPCQYLTNNFFLLAFCCGLAACGKMDATYDEYIQGGEVRYAARPSVVTAHSGNKRIRLTLEFREDSDPQITHVKVYWNFKADSATFTVHTTGGQRFVDVLLNDMPEGSYTFDLFTINKDGNISVKVPVSGNVYDDDFAAEQETALLALRQPVNLVGTDGVIEWFPAAYFAGIEVHYTDVNGDAKTLYQTGASLTMVKVPDVMPGSTLEYRTLYLPDTLAMDTAFSVYTSGQVPSISQLDKTKFAQYKKSDGQMLAGDAVSVASSITGNLTWERMWDDKYGEFDGYQSASQALPQSFTIDLGVTKRIGAFRYFMRGINGINEATYLYNNANPKTWELWGRADEPDADGSYNGWTKLMTCTAADKPSGLPAGQFTDEDRAIAAAGEFFTLPAPFNAMPVRYLRWRTLTNYGNTANTVVIQELAFYETPQ